MRCLKGCFVTNNDYRWTVCQQSHVGFLEVHPEPSTHRWKIYARKRGVDFFAKRKKGLFKWEPKGSKGSKRGIKIMQWNPPFSLFAWSCVAKGAFGCYFTSFGSFLLPSSSLWADFWVDWSDFASILVALGTVLASFHFVSPHFSLILPPVSAPLPHSINKKTQIEDIDNK